MSPLPFADEVRSTRALESRSREARALLFQVDAVRRQLEVLAALDAVPVGYELPGDDVIEVVVRVLNVRPEGLVDAVGRLAFFETAAAVLHEEASHHEERQGALMLALERQQQAMFEPSSRPTLAALKALGGRQAALIEQLGPVRAQLGQLEPLLALVRRHRVAQPAWQERALPQLLAQIGAVVESAEVGTEGALPGLVERLEAQIETCGAQRAELEQALAAIEREMELLTG